MDVTMDVSKHSAYSAYRDYKWAIEINRISLTLLGVWPKNNETKQKTLMSHVRVIIILNLIIWICIIPTLHSLLKIYDDIMLTIYNLQHTLPILMGTLKLFIIWQKKYDILFLLNMIKEDWIKPKTSKERNIMIKQARIARIITTYSSFMLLAAMICAFFLPIFGISMRYTTNRTDPGKVLPIQTYYVYDKDKSPFFEITYALQCTILTLTGIIYTGTDSFLSLLVFHVCGQLENLKGRMVNLDKFHDFSRALSYNVRDHIRLIRSINIIDNVFAILLLGALVYFGTLFAFYGFLFGTVFIQSGDISVTHLTSLTVAFILTFTHMFLYCIIGEILVAQCEAVYEAAYEYNWYTLESKKARDLMIVMIRAKKPLYLTAGKLFPMTMATFCDLIKTSGGYISVLLAHRE